MLSGFNNLQVPVQFIYGEFEYNSALMVVRNLTYGSPFKYCEHGFHCAAGLTPSIYWKKMAFFTFFVIDGVKYTSPL